MATRLQRTLEVLVRIRKPVACGLVLAGVLLAGLGALLGSKKDPDSQLGYAVDWDYWPEALAGILLGLILLGAGLWLALASERDVRVTSVRILVLMTGGLIGLVISLATVARGIRWWSTIFTAGLEGWQGEEGWRLWICILAELAGLAVMFVSLLLAHSEERSNPILRRLMYGYNAALSGLLLLAILVVANILVFVYLPATYTWTQTRGITDLSSKAKNILRGLKKDVHVYLIMAEGSRIYTPVRTLMDNCEAITDRIKVRTLSPDKDSSELTSLLRRFPSLSLAALAPNGQPLTIPDRGVLLIYGDENNAKQSAVAFVPENKLYEGTRTGRTSPSNPGQTLVFKGEDAIFTELNFLTEDRKKPRIYFTQDNGEPDLNQHMGVFRAQLERNMFSVAGLRLRAPSPTIKSDPETTVAKEVPADADVVVAVNPVEPFSKTALDALRGYMAKKGKLLAFVDFDRREPALPKSGLDKLLAEFNVEPEPAFLLRDNQEIGGSPLAVLAFPAENSTNPIALALPRDKPLGPLLARPIKILTKARFYNAAPILQVPVTRFTLWTEDNLSGLLNPMGALRDKKLSLAKPLSESPAVAVAVKDSRNDTPRVVVCGTMDVVLDQTFARDLRYYDFLENSLQWLRGRGEKLGIKPVESRRFTFSAEDVNQKRMMWLSMFLVATGIVGLGAGIWVVRRR